MPRILILIALALLAVTAAGCGSKPTSSGVAQLPSATTTTTSNSAVPTDKAKAIGSFSACMRSHGVRNFPDPKRASGGGMTLSIGPSNGINPNSPQFKAAQKTCQKLLPNGGQASPAEQARAQAQMLKFSSCMRAHGLANFPDPQFSGDGGIRLSIGKGLNPSSPVFQAAQKACQSIMPGPKIKGGGGGSTELRSGVGGGPSSSSSGGK